MPYLPYVERVVETYAKGDDLLRPLEALDIFSGLSGRYRDSDDWYEERSRLFFDYLAFDHPSPPYRSILHRYFVEGTERVRREGLVDLYRGLLSSHAGVFDILKVGRADVTLKDLIGRCHFRVSLPEGAYSFVEGVVINARIIPFRGGLILGHGILLHPEHASPHILKLVEALRGEGILGWTSFFLLARMKLQHDMSPTFKLSSIYSPRSFLIKRA